MRDERIAGCRRQEVDLELHREHADTRWHERERRIAARRVDDRRDRAGVQQAVLLHEIRAKGQANHDVPRLHGFDLGAERRHERLSREAGSHAGGERRIWRLGHVGGGGWTDGAHRM